MVSGLRPDACLRPPKSTLLASGHSPLTLPKRLVTVVPSPYPSGPFTIGLDKGKLWLVTSMASSMESNKRRGSRTKAVLPVRIKGKDRTGKAFEELVHTLDVTASGVRLGSIRRELHLFDEVTVFYRQRKMLYRVVWVKKLKGTSEFQIGLQALTHEKEAWGLSFSEQESQPVKQLAAARVSGTA